METDNVVRDKYRQLTLGGKKSSERKDQKKGKRREREGKKGKPKEVKQ